MKERIDIPDQSTFSDDKDSVKPYFSKYSKPINLIKYTDTVYTKKNAGIKADYFRSYADATNGVDTVYSATMPICKFYYANGYPPFFTANDTDLDWAVKFKFQFYTETDAYHRFYFGGSGRVSDFFHTDESNSDNQVRFMENMIGAWNPFGNYTIGDDLSLSMDDTKYLTTYTTDHGGVSWKTGWQAEKWHSISFIYQSDKKNNTEYGFFAGWRLTGQKPIPFSAGVCCPVDVDTSNASDGNTIVSHTVNGCIKTSYDHKFDQIATFNFDIPFMDSNSNYNYAGYKHSSGNFVDLNSGLEIKKHRMVEYWEGYVSISGVDEYVKMFTGHIKDFNINYKPNGNDTITVYCEDFGSFLKESFNIYNPSPMDYIQVGYIKEKGKNPVALSAGFFSDPTYSNKIVEGRNKPRTFDGWEIDRVIQILMTESFIDPTLFYDKKVFTDRNDIKVEGEYLVRWTNDLTDTLKLDTKLHYGNPNITEKDVVKPDDEYLNKLNMGDYYYDVIMDIIKPYYLDFYFDHNGSPVLQPYNTPYTYSDDRSFTYDVNWSSIESMAHLRGTYSYATTKASVASAEFSGCCIDLICGVGPNAGHTSDAYASITVELLHSGDARYVENFYLYLSTSWGYNDGIYPNLGYNPCILRIGKNMPYDTYTVRITGNPDDDRQYKIELDGILVYDKDYDRHQIIIDSGDTYNQGGITALQVKDSGKDVRNEVYVFGSLKGVVHGTGEDGEKSIKNPNNTINNYNYSISRDINSVYDPTSENYTGRPLRVLIQDPKIHNEEQANLVSYNVLQTYRRSNIAPNFSILPNPLLEVGDCVALYDLQKGYVSTNNPVWINGIHTNQQMSSGKIKYTMKIDGTPIKPSTGYWKKIEIDNNVIDGTYIQNVTTKNAGMLIRTGASISDSVTTIQLQDSNRNQYIPEKGYLRADNEIMYYEHTAADSNYLHNIKRALQGSHSSAHDDNIWIGAFYDPYTGDSMGIYPSINFNIMKSGRIQIKMWAVGYATDYHVATLTGTGEDGYPVYGGWDDVKWGNYTYRWDGIDQIGTYNDIITLGEVPSGGFYAREKRVTAETYQKTTGLYKLSPNEFDFKDIPRPDDSIYDKLKYGDFYFTIEFESYEGDSYEYNSKFQETDYLLTHHIYTKCGPQGMFMFKLHTSGVYSWRGPEHESSLTVESKLPWTDSFYYATVNGFARDSHGTEVFITNNSNAGEGLRTTLYDCSWDVSNSDVFPYEEKYSYTQVDPYAPRKYKANIKYNIVCYVGTYVVPKTSMQGEARWVWNIYPTDGDFINDDQFKSYYNGGNGFEVALQPKGLITSEKESVQWITRDCLNNWDTLRSAGYILEKAVINNYIFFSGEVYDKSGRTVWQRETNDSYNGHFTGRIHGGYATAPANGGLFEHFNKTRPSIPEHDVNWLMLWGAVNGKLWWGEDPKGTGYIDDTWRDGYGLDRYNPYDGMKTPYRSGRLSIAYKGIEHFFAQEKARMRNYVTWMDSDYCSLDDNRSYRLWDISKHEKSGFVVDACKQQHVDLGVETSLMTLQDYAHYDEEGGYALLEVIPDFWWKMNESQILQLIGEG